MTKKTERYTHNIYFIGFSGNTKENIRVDVRFVINKAPYDYTDVEGNYGQAFYYSMWIKNLAKYS